MNWAANLWGRFADSSHNSGPVSKENETMASVTKIASAGQPAAGTVAWFNSCVERSASGVFSEVTTVTPGLAGELLRRNDNNRGVKMVKAGQYASDMIAGRWTFNGEPILISTTGELNDGQHRMQAVIEANLSLPFLFVFGLGRETRETVDQGATRGASDYLAMGGMANAAVASTVSRLVLAYERNGGQNVDTREVTNAEVVRRARSDDGIAKAAVFASRYGRKSNQYVAATVIGFCYYIFEEIDGADAEDYLTQVCTGENLKAGCPAIAVRDRLLAVGKSRQMKVAILLRGWNFHRRGMKVRAGSVKSSMPLPGLI